MADSALRPDLPHAERLAGMADVARRRGQRACADRLLLLAWTALDGAEHTGAGPDRDGPSLRAAKPLNAARPLPPQV